jgi:hypothetical protein
LCGIVHASFGVSFIDFDDWIAFYDVECENKQDSIMRRVAEKRRELEMSQIKSTEDSLMEIEARYPKLQERNLRFLEFLIILFKD